MIITKTPLRMSFVGGGSDLPSYYREHGGAVLTTAIQKYVYLIVKSRFEKGYRVSYSKTEQTKFINDIKHPLVRGALRMLDIDEDLEIISAADIPSSGSGLGSSSSFSVGLINALLKYKNKKVSAVECAELACKLEIEVLGSPIWKQDQYAASLGGLRTFTFHADDSVTSEVLNCDQTTLKKLDEEIISFFIGGNRDANTILKQQSIDITKPEKIKIISQMVSLVSEMKKDLELKSADNFGNILHENWILKKQLSSEISNPKVDSIYEEALSCGASGGKLLGAGGGGFMIFHFSSPDIKLKLKKRFVKLREVKFNLEPEGSSYLVY